MGRLSSVRAAVRDWAYAAPHDAGRARDPRLDLLRGFAVFAMVVDHIGGHSSWLYAVTGGNQFVVSAAEAFLFLAGLSLGLSAAPRVAEGRLAETLMRTLSRAGALYRETVAWTLICVAVAVALGLPWAPSLTEESLPGFVLGVVTLHRSFYLVDILLLYAVLMIGAVLALLLLAFGHSRTVLACSWALWVIWQVSANDAQVPWPIQGSYFQTPAWQILFFTGLVAGYYHATLSRHLRRFSTARLLVVSAALVASAIVVTQVMPAVLPPELVRKETVGPGRLVAFVVFATFAYTLVTIAWRPVLVGVGWLLLPLGRNSLLAYRLHLLVVVLAALVEPWTGGVGRPTVVSVFVQLAGVAAVWLGVTATYRAAPAWWHRAVQRGGRALARGRTCARRRDALPAAERSVAG